MCKRIGLSKAAAVRFGWIALLLGCGAVPCSGADSGNVTLTVMTRNLDASTDLNYILAATDQASLLAGTAATLAQIKASGIPGRAARVADEIAANQPDLIALQEVTLWRTGPLLQPPATEVMHDQLDLLMTELSRRKLSYGIVAVQSLLDAEAPVPGEGVDLRLTDRNVILARTDLPQSQFDITKVQANRYSTIFQFGSPLLGQFVEPAGWISVDLVVSQTKVRFVNTHLETTAVPQGDQIQMAQVTELLAALASPGMPVILAGDFNANAEVGPEHTGAVQKILAAGFSDCWKSANIGDPGYTWPLFGEDQASGPALPNERIDLIFSNSGVPLWFGRDPNVLSAERTGATAPWASDHAGLVVKLRVK